VHLIAEPGFHPQDSSGRSLHGALPGWRNLRHRHWAGHFCKEYGVLRFVTLIGVASPSGAEHDDLRYGVYLGPSTLDRLHVANEQHCRTDLTILAHSRANRRLRRLLVWSIRGYTGTL
jgi:hypothetical protein